MKKAFKKIKLRKDSIELLDKINVIIEEYQSMGYKLTLRQLYYQLVSRDIIENNLKSYQKISNVLKEGRLGGVVDWDAIEDRLRQPYTPAYFSSPKDILNAAISQYAENRQKGQSVYMEVWVEKDALSGVLKRITSKYHIPILVCRGYSSVTAIKDAYDRFKVQYDECRDIKILYLGDFDPSGEDMVRDIRDRILELFVGDKCNNLSEFEFKDIDYWRDEMMKYVKFSIEKIALTVEQINEYNPPPNVAKESDPRGQKFIDEHGSQSFEVDALNPETLNDLLENSIRNNLNILKYEEVLKSEVKGKGKLKNVLPYL